MVVLKFIIMELVVVLAIWAAGLPVAWRFVKKWNKCKAEKYALTVGWPLLAIVYGIHYLVNREGER